MKKIVEIAHDLIVEYVPHCSISVDFTMGRGNDTLFLAQHSTYVYAFDIQQECIEETRKKLNNHQLHNAHLICASHTDAFLYIKEKIDAGIFNFGYLPQSDHHITTMLETSKIAVQKALKRLVINGMLILVLYPGHEEGKKESVYFDKWSQQLSSRDYNVMQIKMWNKENAPYILAIQKLKGDEDHED